MSINRYDLVNYAHIEEHEFIIDNEFGEWVKFEDYRELSQLASKLLKMSTYYILSPEEVKSFNELTGAYSHDTE